MDQSVFSFCFFWLFFFSSPIISLIRSLAVCEVYDQLFDLEGEKRADKQYCKVDGKKYGL